MSKFFEKHERSILQSDMTLRQRLTELGLPTANIDDVRDTAKVLTHIRNGGYAEDAFLEVTPDDIDVPFHVMKDDEQKMKYQMRELSSLHRKHEFYQSESFQKLIEGHDPDTAAVFATAVYWKATQKSKHDPMTEVNKMTDIYFDSKTKLIYNGTIEEDTFSGIDINDLEKSILNMDDEMMRILSVLSLIDTMPAMSTNRVRTVRNDPDGDMIKHRAMETLADSYGAAFVERMLPQFKLKVAKKDLYVRKRCAFDSMSQNLVVLIDNSGSMSCRFKVEWLAALLFNRIQAIKNDNAEIYISLFVTSIYGFTHINKSMTFDELKDVITEYCSLNGGTTDIEHSVKLTSSYIQQGYLPRVCKGEPDILSKYSDKEYVTTRQPIVFNSRKGDDKFHEFYELGDARPEILVINDGDDAIDPRYHPPIKMNAFCLGQENEDLENVAVRSSGIYYSAPFPMDSDGWSADWASDGRTF